MQLSLHIVARTIFDSEVTPEVLSVRDEVNIVMDLYNFLIAFPMLEKFLHWPIPGVVKFRKSRAGRLDKVVAGMIASRRSLSLADLDIPRRPPLHAHGRPRRRTYRKRRGAPFIRGLIADERDARRRAR